MLWRPLVPALAAALLLQGAALAQSSDNNDKSLNLSQQIRDKLTAQGFKDVKIVPGSYLVSAKDKDGHPIMMLIGPGTMTMITQVPSSDQSQAQSPDSGDKIIQQ